MTPLQLKLTKLLGRKELSFGCIVIQEDGYCHTITRSYDDTCEGIESCCGRFEKIRKSGIKEIIGHPATLSDFHRWMNKRLGGRWEQNSSFIKYPGKWDMNTGNVTMEHGTIPYDSSKELLEQEEEILKQIIELVKANSL